jgi:hypothetical protein
MLECSILLEAQDPSQHVFQSYGILAYQDLFQRLIVDVVQGKMGTKGKRTPHYANDAEEAIRLINALLKKRKKPIKRTGTPYILKSYWSNWDFSIALTPFRPSLESQATTSVVKPKQSIVLQLQEIIKEGEGLFCYDEPLLFY